MKRSVLLFFLIVLLPFSHAMSEDIVPGFGKPDARPVPRFVSVKSDKAYVRAGPGQTYPIKWVYSREGIPVEVVQEYDTWRKIRDFDGEEGWMHSSLLTGERHVIVKGTDTVALRDRVGVDGRIRARLEPRVIAKLDECANGWCLIDAQGYEGWIERNLLWGIYDTEELN